MSYRYATLNRNCSARTTAITSNTKYLYPLDEVYNNMCTQMMMYPGQNNTFTTRPTDVVGADIEPEHIKAFNIQTQATVTDNPNQMKCKTCGGN